MTRRKSRPLLPHEIYPNLHSSQEDTRPESSSRFSLHGSSQQQIKSSQSSAIDSQSTVNCLYNTVSDRPLANTAGSGPAVTLGIPLSSMYRGSDREDSEEALEKFASFKSSTDKARLSTSDLIKSFSQTGPAKRRPGYLANRRSASFVIHDESETCVHPSLSTSNSAGPIATKGLNYTLPQPLKRTSSLVRLSMSLDGKAQVTTGTGTTPSPPRSPPTALSDTVPRANTSLQRSYSAIEPINKSGSASTSVPFTRRTITGRSRDARTWEFYCDSDARNALTEQAEREERGSATAAIGLIKSQSNNSKAMNPNPNKRNAHTQKHDMLKRLKAEGKKPNKPKLARATSSLARLQTTDHDSQKPKGKNIGDKKAKELSHSTIWQEYEGDSDKENWEPGTQTSNARRRRPATSQQSARILDEGFRVPTQSSSLDTLMNSENTRPSRSSSGSTSDGDDEVAASMGESIPRKVEDLDCVQNLLSLSQAVWR